MSLTNCKECNEEISKKAKTCPKCGAPNKPKEFSILWIFLIGGLSWWAYSSFNPSPPSPDNNCADKSSAYNASRRLVRSKLKNPKSADFPLYSSSQSYMGECKHRVVAYVDAQNAFGADVRTKYTAIVQYNKASKKWRGMC